MQLITDEIKGYVANSSMIRRMFEAGIELRKKYGADKVYDFSLGNPDLPPPPEVKQALEAIAARADRPFALGYMPNAGYPALREKLAVHLSKEQNVTVPASHVIMTCGAAHGDGENPDRRGSGVQHAARGVLLLPEVAGGGRPAIRGRAAEGVHPGGAGVRLRRAGLRAAGVLRGREGDRGSGGRDETSRSLPQKIKIKKNSRAAASAPARCRSQSSARTALVTLRRPAQARGRSEAKCKAGEYRPQCGSTARRSARPLKEAKRL